MNLYKSTILIICIWLVVVHGSQCAANYGSSYGDPACCGQIGRVGNMKYVCPAQFPKCVGYVRGQRWGKCTDLVIDRIPDLKFYLKVDDYTSGHAWVDRVSNVEVNVPVSASFHEGHVHLSGTAITAPLQTNPNIMHSATYVIRFRVPTIPSNLGWVMSQGPDYGWSRALTIADHRLGFVGQTPGDFTSGLGSFPTDSWQVLVGTWTQGGTCQTFLQGTSGNSRTCSNGVGTDSNEKLIIGGRAETDATHNPNSIDISDVLVFNRALNTDEINFITSTLSEREICWEESKDGTDLASGEWDGSGQTSYAQCEARAEAANSMYFAWTGQVYNGYCKVLKSGVSSPNLNTDQGYGYKLYENTCRTRLKSWSCPISGRSPGTSLGQVFVKSMDDCKASCESTQGCKAIIWNKSKGGCYRLDRFYEGKYEKVSDDRQVANYGIDQRCDAPSVTAPPVPTRPVPTRPVPTRPVPTRPVPTRPVPAPPVPTRPTTGMTAECRTCLDRDCPGTEDSQWWSCRECVQLCAVSWFIENPSLIPWLPGRRKLSNSVFSEAAAPGACLRKKIKDIGMVLGNRPHTIQVRLSFPYSAPTARQWILNLGQPTTGAHHWLWKSDLSGQIGEWNGDQVNNFDISGCTFLTTTSSGKILKLYCDGTLLGQRSADFDIKTPELSIGLETVGTMDREADFAGCISEVSIFAYEKSRAEVAQSDAVFGKIPECLDCHLNECNLWTMDQYDPESCRMCMLTHCGGSQNPNLQPTALPGLFWPGTLPNPDSDISPFFSDTFMPGRRKLRNSVDLAKVSDPDEDEAQPDADKEFSSSDEISPITRRLLRLILD